MKKKILIIILLILISILFTYLNDRIINEKDSYLTVITKVYNRDIKAVAVTINYVSDMQNNEFENYSITTGSKKNYFGANTNDGVILSATKDLFLSIENLNIAREIISFDKEKYYIIQMNLQFEGGNKNTEVHKLFLLIDIENNHILIPENYIDPNKIWTISTKYIEYELTEVEKNLINNILRL